MNNPYQVTKDFEDVIARYTGSPYAVAIDNQTNALFLCLTYFKKEGTVITIPSRTYMSVPCAIIQAGYKVKFDKNHPNINGSMLKGAYQLDPLPIWDSALSFHKDMYEKKQFMCLSFSGPHKYLKLGKGGMILTDDEKAYHWLKKARYNGRNEINHLSDNFTMLGWNFYLLPDIASRGLVQMLGMDDNNKDLEIEYQDLSKFKIYESK